MGMSLNNDCDHTMQFDLHHKVLREDNLNKMDPELWLLDIQQERTKSQEDVHSVRIDILPPEQPFMEEINAIEHDDHAILSEEFLTTSVRLYSQSFTTETSGESMGDELQAVGATVVNNTILVEAELSEQSKNQSVLCKVAIFVVIALFVVATSTSLATITLKKRKFTPMPLLPTNAPSRTQFEHVAITQYPNQTIGEGYMGHQHVKKNSKSNLELLAGGQEFLDLINRTSVNMTVFGQTAKAFEEFIRNTPLLLKMVSEVWYSHSVSKNCSTFITITL